MTGEKRRDAEPPHAPRDTRREEAVARETRREDEARSLAPTRREGVEGGMWRLPHVIASRFSVVKALDAAGSEADGYLVCDTGGRLCFAKVYRRGVSPNSGVMERLSRAAPENVVELIEAGYSEDDRCHYELLEYVQNGTLADLIAAEGPRLTPSLVRAVVKELNIALQHIHELKVEHRDLKPANVLVRRRDPLDLVLTDFGISSAMDATKRFTSTARTVLYAPPEAISGSVHRTRWDYWSLGIIIVELLTGKHPFLTPGEPSSSQRDLEQNANHRLVAYPTDELTEGVDEPSWRKLCRGLLRRQPEARWDCTAVERWLENPEDPSLVVQEEAERADQVPAIRFLGKAYRTPAQVGGALALNWNEGLHWWQTEQPVLFRWLRHDLGESALVGLLEKEKQRWQGSKVGPHAQLFSVIHVLAPEREPSFLGRSVSATEIRRAADGAVGGQEHDAEWLVELYHNSILIIAAKLPHADKSLDEISSAWNSAVDKYQREGAKARSGSGDKVAIPALEGARLAVLIGAATSGCTALNALRKKAAACASDLACRKLWFSALGNPRKASAPSALLMYLLAKAAEGEALEDRRKRTARNTSLWSFMILGFLVGGAVPGVWWMAVDAYCSGGAAICLNAGWPKPDLSIVEIVVLAVLGVLGMVILARVHLLTTRGGRHG